MPAAAPVTALRTTLPEGRVEPRLAGRTGGISQDRLAVAPRHKTVERGGSQDTRSDPEAPRRRRRRVRTRLRRRRVAQRLAHAVQQARAEARRSDDSCGCDVSEWRVCAVALAAGAFARRGVDVRRRAHHRHGAGNQRQQQGAHRQPRPHDDAVRLANHGVEPRRRLHSWSMTNCACRWKRDLANAASPLTASPQFARASSRHVG
jgi:hypothetical protein